MLLLCWILKYKLRTLNVVNTKHAISDTEGCNYMNITMQEYYDAIEKFRSPHLLKKVNGEWELKSPIWNEN